jgi:uncharacterized protein (TIGR02996 family)
VAELLAVIATQPDDPDPQLVLADHLLAAGDPRGELLVLDHLERSTPGGLADPAAIERLLLLAATYGFPCVRDEVPSMLPFEAIEGGGGYPVRYALHHEGRHYNISYNYRQLSAVSIEGNNDIYVSLVDTILSGTTFSGQLTDEEQDVILTLLSDAIRVGTPLDELQFPYAGAPLPQYPGAPLRAYWLPEPFVAAHGLSRNCHGLAARDYHRWHALWERLQRLPPSTP